jgi:hypothetical protein
MNARRVTSDEEFLRERRDALAASVEYFNSTNKSERERWVCEMFLRNLGTRFKRDDICLPDSDPPDVIFRRKRKQSTQQTSLNGNPPGAIFHTVAAFEVKDVLDPGRRRHAEYKEEHARAMRATAPKELLHYFEPKSITPSEVLECITKKVLCESLNHYGLGTRGALDLLVYVNLLEHILKPDRMPDASHLSSYGWRSVSAIQGWHSLVFYTSKDAPKFLKLREGHCCERRSRT